MYIVLVEDDHLQAEWVESCLKEAFGDLKIDKVTTESEFYSWLEEVEDERPDVFIVDVMLRWADPGPDMPEPPLEVKKNGFYRAGRRCQESIAGNQKLSHIPIILYTVLEELDLEALDDKQPNVFYLRKDSEPELLIKKIRQVLRR